MASRYENNEIQKLKDGRRVYRTKRMPNIPKKDTDPKSDRVSMATSESPATIAGLAEGRIILKKDFFFEKPRFFPSSIKFCDW